ncbi:MAG: DUF2391 family protein [Candidatus Aenigmarchaeota archaeon]|nr:DUF2391 family protein [Candidatus Aenigmarchaeota archaeon]
MNHIPKVELMQLKKLVQKFLRNRLGLTLPKKNGSRFQTKDVAQQIIGAILFASPFIITQELWELAFSLNLTRIIILLTSTVINSILIVYFAEYQKLKKEIEGFDLLRVPIRLISLLVVSYTVSTTLLWTIGVIGIKIVNPIWSIKLVILTSFFASIGAATADIIK